MTTASVTLPRVGFVGLGVMGAPMASHLARAGHPLQLFDVVPDVAAALAAELGGGATASSSPAALAAASDVVITMVPDGEVVASLVSAPGGLAEGFASGSLLIDTSSSQPWLTERTAALLATRGVGMVDAPVSGARHGAEAAELVFMVGGAEVDVARARPLLQRLGHEVFHVGAIGAGHAMKCLNNLITAVNLEALAEGLAIGKRYGLDPAAMADVLDRSTAGSWVSKTLVRRRILSRAFDDPFRLALMVKDIGIAMELGRTTATPTPLSGLAQQNWRAAAQRFGPEGSVVDIARWVESMAGCEIRPGRDPAARATAASPIADVEEAPASVVDKP